LKGLAMPYLQTLFAKWCPSLLDTSHAIHAA
jgi:hypothetical protein